MFTLKTPPKVTVEETPAGQLITYRWQDPSDLISSGIAASMLVVAAIVLYAEPLNFFTYVFTLVASVVSYVFFAKALNKTRIYVTNNDLSVGHGPLPWRGSFRVESKKVEQVYYIEVKGKGTSYLVQLNVGGGKHYVVTSVDRKNDAEKIVASIRKPIDAINRASLWGGAPSSGCSRSRAGEGHQTAKGAT